MDAFDEWVNRAVLSVNAACDTDFQQWLKVNLCIKNALERDFRTQALALSKKLGLSMTCAVLERKL